MNSLRIVLVGSSLARYPDGGGAWAFYLQYVLGLRALGHEVWTLVLLWGSGSAQTDRTRIASFFARMRQFELDEHCMLLFFESTTDAQDLDIAEVFGATLSQTKEIFRTSDLLWNVAAGVRHPLLGMFRNRTLVDVDPGHLQVGSLAEDIGIMDHQEFLTVGANINEPDCEVPRFGLDWKTFLPFVYLPMWSVIEDPGESAPFSSITHWTWGRELDFQGRLVSTSKRDAYMRYLELPRHAGRPFQLAAFILPEDDTGDREVLDEYGWELVEPWEVAASPESYRAYIAGCRAEISCPKPVFRELRTGWFSDRSACFLASGRPVLAEDTGLRKHLPSGEGLLLFSTPTEAVEGVREIDGDYARHSKAARRVAEEHLDSRAVLTAMLDSSW